MRSHDRESFLLAKNSKSYIDYKDDDLNGFRECFNLACVDQSNPIKAGLSWSIFFLLSIGVPILSHFSLACHDTCDEDHRQPFDAIVELSLSSICVLSYFCLTRFKNRYGLSKFLFLDKLCEESDKVREGYTVQLQRSIKLLCIFVLPCFAADTAYKIWWYTTGGTRIPHWGNVIVSHSVACFLEQCSWLYRASMFSLVCVLYRMSCYLQLLRLEEFAQVFQLESDVAAVLIDHLRIRKTLRIISHRFRAFILFTLLIVTASLLASLLVTTKSTKDVDIYTTGELALCSVSLVTGLCTCLRSAAKITHRAQAITSLAAKWHVSATIDSFDGSDGENPILHSASPTRTFFPYHGQIDSDDEEGDDEDDLDNTNIMPTFVNTISYQKRQALVTYLENNKAGITVFGFMLDRSYLHTIFGVELSLVLWLLSKTVGIS